MKRVGNNDIVEFVDRASAGQKPEVVGLSTQYPDYRAVMVESLIRAWGASIILGDLMSGAMMEAHDKPPSKPIPPAELVMRCAAVVDAFWDEMTHRGWIVKVDQLGGEP